MPVPKRTTNRGGRLRHGNGLLEEHSRGYHHHQDTEEDEQLLTVEMFAERRSKHCTYRPRRGENQGTAPLHVMLACVTPKVHEGAQRHGDGTRADSDVRGPDADEIDEQGDGEDRTAAPNQPQNETDKGARDAR